MSYSDYGLDDVKKSQDEGTKGKSLCIFCGEDVNRGFSLCFSNWVICKNCVDHAYDEKNKSRWLQMDECYKCHKKEGVGYRNNPEWASDIYLCKDCMKWADEVLNKKIEMNTQENLQQCTVEEKSISTSETLPSSYDLTKSKALEVKPELKYSDDELAEFKQNILERKEKALKELDYLNDLVSKTDPEVEKHEHEQLEQMATRQSAFIDNLNAALDRIENKTYGICRVTGKLIDKARLLAVPHATLSLEAKLGANKNAPDVPVIEVPKKEKKKRASKKSEQQPATVRYSDDDLRNFKTLISNKIDIANEELKYLKVVLMDRNRGIKVEDYEETTPEEVEALIDRKKSFISELESALDRVKKKTYGICEETKQLIPKEILLQSPIIKRLSPTPERASSVIENNRNESERKCRICGCTENDCSQCIEKTGEPCHWVEEDLCSACADQITTSTSDETEPAIEDIEVISESVEDEALVIKSDAPKIELSEAEKKHLEELENNHSTNDNDMNFFQQLAQAGAQNVDITLRIMQKDGKLTVGIMPGVKSATLKPVNMTGTPAELDAEFFKTIMPGVSEIRGIVTNLENVRKEIEKKKNEPPAKTKAPTSGSHKSAAKKPAAKKQEKKAGAKKADKPEKKKEEIKEEKVVDAEPNMFG